MGSSMTTKKCTVCSLPNTDKTLSYCYQGVEHYFCSPLCQNRFKTHPHLYVGDPQHGLAPKQKGDVLIKKRRIRLLSVISNDARARLITAVTKLMGVQDISIEGDEVLVVYDLMKIALEDIEAVIVKSVGQLDEAVTEKIKRGFIHYSEECELDNLAHLTKDSGSY